MEIPLPWVSAVDVDPRWEETDMGSDAPTIAFGSSVLPPKKFIQFHGTLLRAVGGTFPHTKSIATSPFTGVSR